MVKRIVGEIKQLAREYAVMRGDPELLQRIERAMEAESETVAKRRAAMAARATLGGLIGPASESPCGGGKRRVIDPEAVVRGVIAFGRRLANSNSATNAP